jgi:antitoxin YefM
MDAKSFTDVRATLAGALDRVCDDHNPLIITRHGKPSVVLMSLEDYESLDGAARLTWWPANAERLSRSIRELEAGGGVTMNLDDLVP